ncbi:unnamed protein product [Closterium sp. NIES-54]
MAPTPTLNNGNSSNPASDSDRNTRDLAGERRNKRRAEDGLPAPTAVDVLLGGLEFNKAADAQQHPSAPVAPVAPAAQVAMAAGTAHASDAEHTPAPAAGPSPPPAPAVDNDTDDSEDEAGEAPVNNVNFNVMEHLPPLPSSNLTFSAATFVNDSVREQAELLEDLRAYLLHAEYKAQRGDPTGGLELISHALNLISGRFEVLQVEDTSDFRTAKCFKLYQQKSLLTSRPFKQAVADMAAMDRAASGYARVNRGGNNALMPFLPKRGPSPTANCFGSSWLRSRLWGSSRSWSSEPGGAEPGGTEPGGAESARVASRSASSRWERLSPQELREWFARRWSRAAGAGGPPVAPGPGGARTGGTGAVGTGGVAAAAGVGPAGASGAAGAGATGGVGAGVGAAGASGAAGAGATAGVGAGVGPVGGTAGAAGGTGAAGPTGVGAVEAEVAAGTGAAAGGTGAVPVGTGGPARPRPYFVPLLEQVLGLPPSPGPAPSLKCPQPVQSQSPLQPVSPLPAPSPYAGPTGGLAERREPVSRPASPVCTTRTSRCAPRLRPPAVPGTHQMTMRPSTAPLRVPLPSPPASSLPVLADPASDSLRAASPIVTRLLSTVVTDPSFESIAASALVAELVDFAARCRLDYAASLVAESASVCPLSVRGECALSTDVLEDRQEEFQCFAAALPHLVSTLIAPEGDPDAPDIPTPRSYAEAIEG